MARFLLVSRYGTDAFPAKLAATVTVAREDISMRYQAPRIEARRTIEGLLGELVTKSDFAAP